jgi:hypothetical protein
VDADRIGLEAAAVLTGICEGGSVLGYDPQAKTWSLAELLASFALPDGFDAYVPLSSLDKTDSEIHFKVLAYTFSGMCPPQSISLTVQDAAPDVGKPAAVATESRSELVAPQLLSPADGAVLDIVPRKTLLKWSTVPGAVGYLVQVQYQDPSGDPTGPGGWRPMVFRRTPDSAAEFDFVGAQTGRWRVWPIDANGLAGQARGWLSFRYLR